MVCHFEEIAFFVCAYQSCLSVCRLGELKRPSSVEQAPLLDNLVRQSIESDKSSCSPVSTNIPPSVRALQVSYDADRRYSGDDRALFFERPYQRGDLSVSTPRSCSYTGLLQELTLEALPRVQTRVG